MTLTDWLSYIQSQHTQSIALGLERVDAVAQRLHIQFACPVITVAGTNGKGSTCAYLESILHIAGYKVGCYTSPHVMHFHERIRMGGTPVSDAQLIAAFEVVETAREKIPLTYFEYATLAGLWLFQQANLEVIILEVGLGGRLDAVNIIDADIAVVTAIDLDHQAYLGNDREQIGREKAGIFRAQQTAIISDVHAPRSVIETAEKKGTTLRRIGGDFGFHREATHWQYQSAETLWSGLPFPALRGAYQLANAAGSLAVLEALRSRLPVTLTAIKRGLLEVEIPGRFQIIPGDPLIILDVAHNPHAVRSMLDNLGQMGFFQNTYAVFGMMADKDIAQVLSLTKSAIDHWFVAPLPELRSASAAGLAFAFQEAAITQVTPCDTIDIALNQARESASGARPGHPDGRDRIIVFGSFVTVAQALSALEKNAFAK